MAKGSGKDRAPYLDPNVPVEERVADLLGRMSLDEKIAQLGAVEPGAVEVMIGSASDDIRLSGEFEIVGKTGDIGGSKKFFSTATVS